MKRDEAISILSGLRPALEARGVVHAGIFGSVARGEAGPRSDVDVVVLIDDDAYRHLFNLGGIQTLLEEAFPGRGVDVVLEPVNRDSLRKAIERDRAVAF
jgi:predicted nucleotidyltransferase